MKMRLLSITFLVIVLLDCSIYSISVVGDAVSETTLELEWQKVHSFNRHSRGWRRIESAQPSEFVSLTLYLTPANDLTQVLHNISDPRSSSYGQHLSIHQIRQFIRPAESSLKLVYSWLDSFLSYVPSSHSPPSHSAHSPSHSPLMTESLTGDSIDINVPAAIAIKAFGLTSGIHWYIDPQGIRTLASETRPTLPHHLSHIITYVHGVHLPPLIQGAPRHPSPTAGSAAPSPSPAAGGAGGAPGVPLPNSGQAGNGTLYLLLLPTCLDGSLTQNASAPCSNAPPTINSYEIMYTQDGVNTTRGVDVTDATCSLSAYFPGMFCSMSVGGVKDGVMLDIYARSVFSNGTTSAYGHYQEIFPTVFTDPHTLYRLYNVPSDTVTSQSATSQGMVQFDSASYSPADLQDFLNMYDLPQVKTKVIGVNNPHYVNYEPQLDMQMLSGVGRGAETWAWITDSDGDYLTWATAVNNATETPLVFSISYGSPADGTTQAFRDGLDFQLKKIGVRGITVTVSTGDDGAQVGNYSCDRLKTSVLASSPFVTAVGGTTLNLQGIQTGVQIDKGMYYTASGGFSWYRPRPSYQADAVAEFLNTSSNLPPAHVFNAPGRAIPDVSAIGLNEMVISGGALLPSGGTSTSSPIVAGLITLLNDARLGAGKSPLGFVNPLFYQHPELFGKVQIGDDKCAEWQQCCDWGFFATTDTWSPIGGLGVLDYEALRKLVLSLP
jgi:Pro-kumamolisin, activation domain/Subtilase family